MDNSSWGYHTCKSSGYLRHKFSSNFGARNVIGGNKIGIVRVNGCNFTGMSGGVTPWTFKNYSNFFTRKAAVENTHCNRKFVGSSVRLCICGLSKISSANTVIIISILFNQNEPILLETFAGMPALIEPKIQTSYPTYMSMNTHANWAKHRNVHVVFVFFSNILGNSILMDYIICLRCIFPGRRNLYGFLVFCPKIKHDKLGFFYV